MKFNPYPGLYPSLGILSFHKSILSAVKQVVGSKEKLGCCFFLEEDFLGEVQVPDEIIVFCHITGIKVPPDIVAEKLRPERFIVIISETEGVGIEVFGATRFAGREKMDVSKSA